MWLSKIILECFKGPGLQGVLQNKVKEKDNANF
jgi:hypothetical protein